MPWVIPSSRVLTLEEIRVVLFELHRKARRSPGTRRALVVFRLACCCGLRASEVTGLRLSDVRTECQVPVLEVRSSVGKGSRGRVVPLWWDRGTLEDLRSWRLLRLSGGAGEEDWFLSTRSGGRLSRQHVRRIFRWACAPLGQDRKLTIHDGRRTFITHAIDSGRNLVEVKEAVGHSSLATTSVYAGAIRKDLGVVGEMFR